MSILYRLTTTNQLYIADITNSYGCHSDDDENRAIDVAEKILEHINAGQAQAEYMKRIDGDDHDAMLADLWEKAEQMANEAFTEGWAKPDNVMISIEAR